MVPTSSMTAEPTAKPITVPPIARSAVDPVVRAVVRSTDMAPSTTQKPWETSVISAIATAMASPRAPRTLFWNQTDRTVRCPVSTLGTASMPVDDTVPVAAPGVVRPTSRSSSGRASAAADAATV